MVNNESTTSQGFKLKAKINTEHLETCEHLETGSPVGFMQLRDFLFKFPGLIWGQFKITNIIHAMQFWVIVSQFRLDGVRAEEG